LLAYEYVGKVDEADLFKQIDDAVRESELCRPKWESRKDYRENTINKAIENAKKNKAEAAPLFAAPVEPAAQAAAGKAMAASAGVQGTMPHGTLEITDIPPYNPAIEDGFSKAVVDAVCNGTTIPRQFMHRLIRTFVRTLASPFLKFENLRCNPTSYANNIGESGTGKRLVLERGIFDIFAPLIAGRSDPDGLQIVAAKALVKMIETPDSGAGIRDAFFDPPDDVPIFVVIDEALTLANKANEAKNPEITDAIIELKDSTTITRTKAKKGKGAASKTHQNARLGLYVCSQHGEITRQAFQGRKRQGIDERLELEFSPAVEPGDLPNIPAVTKADLCNQLLRLLDRKRWTEPLSMTPEAKQFLDAFWNGQPKEIKQKVRLRQNLIIEVCMRAFDRGESVANIEDARLYAEYFERDKIIRAVHFRGEIASKVGLYIQRLTDIVEAQRVKLNKGQHVALVALSKRDLQTQTYAHKDNEVDIFNRAWTAYAPANMWRVGVRGTNGHAYEKYIPMAHEHEVWPQLANTEVKEVKANDNAVAPLTPAATE
jgi:hypothetical protein